MDEIFIEEKKYISSKRAAKITGYAKDYVGQLCREGRISARLIGRNWYALETAIQDHRFGDSKVEPKPEKDTKITPSPSVFPSTWETPRYEAFSEEILPSLNRLREELPEKSPGSSKKEIDASENNSQDSWRAWFDRFDHMTDIVKPELETEPEIVEDTAPVDIPIRAVSRSIPSELLPRHFETELSNGQKQQRKSVHKEKRKGSRTIMRTIQICGVLLAITMAAVAFIGSGYLDTYILSSNSQIRIIAGVDLYNR